MVLVKVYSYMFLICLDSAKINTTIFIHIQLFLWPYNVKMDPQPNAVYIPTPHTVYFKNVSTMDPILQDHLNFNESSIKETRSNCATKNWLLMIEKVFSRSNKTLSWSSTHSLKQLLLTSPLITMIGKKCGALLERTVARAFLSVKDPQI